MRQAIRTIMAKISSNFATEKTKFNEKKPTYAKPCHFRPKNHGDGNGRLQHKNAVLVSDGSVYRDSTSVSTEVHYCNNINNWLNYACFLMRLILRFIATNVLNRTINLD